MKPIDIPSVLVDALARCEADADFERCLRDATACACGDDPDAFDEVLSVLERRAEEHDISLAEAARRFEAHSEEERPVASAGLLGGPWQKAGLCVLAILGVGMPIGYHMWKEAKRGGESELISIKEAVDAYDRRHRRVESEAAKATRKAEEQARAVLAARTLLAMRETVPPAASPNDPLVRQHTANVRRYMELTGLKGTPAELREMGAAGEVLAKGLLARDDLGPRSQVGGQVVLGLFLLAQGRLIDAEGAALAGQVVDEKDPRPDMLLAQIHEQRGEYDRGIAADERALAKFETWWPPDEGRLQDVLWALGRARIVDGLRWQREVANIVRDFNRLLKTHIMRLRAHKGVAAVKALLKAGAQPPAPPVEDGAETPDPTPGADQPPVDSGGK